VIYSCPWISFNALHLPCSITAFQHHVARSLRFRIGSPGSSPCSIIAFHHHLARSLRFLAGSPSAPCGLLLTLVLLQRPAFALLDHCVSTPCVSITAVPRTLRFTHDLGSAFALLDHCVSTPCDSITAVPRYISRFFALLVHCVSSPCGLDTAVPRRISFSASRSRRTGRDESS